MTAGICAQLLALVWFALPQHGPALARGSSLNLFATTAHRTTVRPYIPAPRPTWMRQQKLYNQHLASWRLAAAACTLLCVGLSTALWATASASVPIIHVAAEEPLTLAGNVTIPGFSALVADDPDLVGWVQAAMPILGRQWLVVLPGKQESQ